VGNAYADDCLDGKLPSSDLVYEMTDLVMVVLNCFQHYGIDFEEQLRINIKRNENRICIGSKDIDE
jgi:NTP pyrophosphatase (non-canonical NTP hydrolase)